MIVVQINVEKVSKEKHSDNQNTKKNDEKKVLMMKNNENSEYSKTIEIADEKKNQILKCSTSNHADDHVTEESDHCNDEHKNRQEHVIHVVSIMFDRADNDDYSASVVKRWHEELMQQNQNQVHEMKQSKIT